MTKGKSCVPQAGGFHPPNDRKHKRKERKKRRETISRESLYQKISKAENASTIGVDELRGQFMKERGATVESRVSFGMFPIGNFKMKELIAYKNWLIKLSKTRRGVFLIADLGIDFEL